MAGKYRVPKKILADGAKDEQKEHPWASPRTSCRIARNHIEKYGPGYYAVEPITMKFIKNANEKMKAKPIRRKRRAKPWTPLSGGVPPGVW